MGRQPRIEYKGAIYHVFQRGNNKASIFESSALKIFYLNQLKFLKGEMGFEIFSYAVMNNHYHFLIQTNDAVLSSVMQRLNTRFSPHYNRVNEHINHVFGDRYKAILVTNERYLLWVLRYIHNNPVKAGLSREMNFYKWSSDLHYRNNVESWVNTGFILDMMHPERKHALKVYQRLMKGKDEVEYSDDDIENINQDDLKLDLQIYSNYNFGPPPELEDELFETIAAKSLESKSKKTTLMHKNDIFSPSSSEESMVKLHELFNNTIPNSVVRAMILSGGTSRSLTPFKVKFILNAYRQRFPISQIAEFLKLTEKGIFRLMNSKQ
jgi:REP element-mobilizing transposase RayT